MNQNAKALIKEISALVTAWRVIENDYNDCEDKDIAQDIIDELLIAKCEDLAGYYQDEDADTPIISDIKDTIRATVIVAEELKSEGACIAANEFLNKFLISKCEQLADWYEEEKNAKR